MKYINIHTFALGVLAICVVVYFFRLFYPQTHLIVTPDFGKSDVWHFSFATKYLLSESLKQGTLPLWNEHMGRGFPLLGEGQTGVFFLPNLVLYTLFSTAVAYNLSLICIFLLFGSGIYCLFIHFRISPVLALFGAISLTFSGITIPQIPHIALLQGLSMFPFTLLAGFRFIEHPSIKRGAILALLGSQQFFAGFPQVSVLTWGLIFGFIFYKATSIKQSIILHIFVGIVLIGTLLLSSAQLLPSVEFLKYTDASGGFDQHTATYFSYPYKQLLTLIDPYLLGNPRDGSFPAFFDADGTIFWETSGFVGILPLIGFFILCFRPVTNKKLKIALLLFLAISMLFMFGKYSPLYFIFSFPPLNLFRVPARFLWYFCLALVLMGAFGLDYIKSKLSKRNQIIFSFLLISIQIIHLFIVWYQYHLIQPYKDWIQPPEVVSYLSDNPTVFSLNDAKLHNTYFLSKGWENNPNIYQFLRNTLTPNAGVYWNIQHMNVYAGRSLARQSITELILEEQITRNDTAASMSALGKQMLQLYGVNNIITPTMLDGESPTATVSGEDTLYIYTVSESLPRVYDAQNIVRVETLDEVARELHNPSYSPRSVTLVEHEMSIQRPKHQTSIDIVDHSNNRLEIQANNPNPHEVLLVIQDTYYPGWIATINQNPTKIYPANVRNRAVVIPPGKSTILFRYQPKSFTRGIIISGVSFLIAIVLACVPIDLKRRIAY